MATAPSTAPLRFMRQMLCMTTGAHPRASCGQTVSFDAFSVHPYTEGGPTHSAAVPNDVSIYINGVGETVAMSIRKRDAVGSLDSGAGVMGRGSLNR